MFGPSLHFSTPLAVVVRVHVWSESVVDIRVTVAVIPPLLMGRE
jgi:hypothetical protein